MKNIISHSEAKQARALAKLSQGRVASDLGINRTYLSLFESGKYVLDDSVLIDLRDYYRELGFEHDHSSEDFDEGQDQVDCGYEASEGVIARDGVEAPPLAYEIASEEHLNIRSENTRKIQEICSKKVKRGLLGGIDRASLNAELEKVVLLMAENELMTARKDGLEYSALWADANGDEPLYVGHYLAERLLNPKKITEDDWWIW